MSYAEQQTMDEVPPWSAHGDVDDEILAPGQPKPADWPEPHKPLPLLDGAPTIGMVIQDTVRAERATNEAAAWRRYVQEPQRGRMAAMAAAWASAGPVHIIETGHPGLDSTLKLLPGQTSVILAEPGGGKSTFLRSQAIHEARRIRREEPGSGACVIYVALEEPPELLWPQFAGRGDLKVKVCSRALSGAEVADVDAALDGLPIYIISRPVAQRGPDGVFLPRPLMTGRYIRNTIDSLVEEHGLDVRLICVDYLQNVQCDDDAGEGGTYLAVREFSSICTEMSQQHSTHVMIASQVVRPAPRGKGDPVLRLPDLRSGQWGSAIEQDASVVIGVASPASQGISGSVEVGRGKEYVIDENLTIVKVLKNRHGAVSPHWVPVNLDVVKSQLSLRGHPSMPARIRDDYPNDDVLDARWRKSMAGQLDLTPAPTPATIAVDSQTGEIMDGVDDMEWDNDTRPDLPGWELWRKLQYCAWPPGVTYEPGARGYRLFGLIRGMRSEGCELAYDGDGVLRLTKGSSNITSIAALAGDLAGVLRSTMDLVPDAVVPEVMVIADTPAGTAGAPVTRACLDCGGPTKGTNWVRCDTCSPPVGSAPPPAPLRTYFGDTIGGDGS